LTEAKVRYKEKLSSSYAMKNTRKSWAVRRRVVASYTENSRRYISDSKGVK
jgi:hypothetical protein